MPDAIFEHPRLAAVYDALDPDRSDLDAYAGMVEEFGARHVLDIGCGTGTFALLLASRGVEVVGVEPAAASLDVARHKPGAQRVAWLHGSVLDLPPLSIDLATMTANVAQAITDPADWDATLSAAFAALVPGGRLAFETRVPSRRAWEQWTREQTHDITDVPGVGVVESWIDLLQVALPLVSFRGTYRFASDDVVLTSDSTLRFREREEIAADLDRHGYVSTEIRDAPDRPGREWVFIARRPQ